MKKQLALVASCLLTGFCSVLAGTLAHGPILFVQPSTLNFGAVQRTQSATNSFVVENLGTGALVGTVEVSPPFKIVSGESYKLKRGQIQVVTVVYTPDNTRTNIETVKFTGGGDNVNATVMGKLLTSPPSSRPKHK